MFVIPTTTLAVFSGCRNHKDRMVAVFAALGLLILTSATALEGAAKRSEGSAGSPETVSHAGEVTCADCCAVDANPERESRASLAFPNLSTGALLNLTGGLFLILGHIRNFRLCRATRCCEGLDGIR